MRDKRKNGQRTSQYDKVKHSFAIGNDEIVTDSEMVMYMRGWNSAISCCECILGDFLIIKEEEFNQWGGNGTTGRMTSGGGGRRSTRGAR